MQKNAYCNKCYVVKTYFPLTVSDSAFRSTEGREKQATISNNWCDLPEPHPFKPAFHLSHEMQQNNLSRESLKCPVKLFLNENIDLERHKSCQTNTMFHLTPWDKSWDPRMIHETDGKQSSSLYRKRHLEGCSFDDVKQARNPKQLEPSSLSAPSTDPSIRRIQVQQMSISSLCRNGCKCITSYPGTELHPYQTASWEQTWNHRMDVNLRQKVFREYFSHSFQCFLGPRLYSPLALRCQDAIYLRNQDTLPSF